MSADLGSRLSLGLAIHVQESEDDLALGKAQAHTKGAARHFTGGLGSRPAVSFPPDDLQEKSEGSS